MTKTKKIILAAILSVLSLCVLTASVWATFSDYSFLSTDAKAGNVDIEVSGLTLTNSGNINPGDCDITMPQDPSDPRNGGTEHKLRLKVENKGTKSVKTRNVVTISLEDTSLDPSVFMLTENGKEIENSDKIYVVEGKEVFAKDYKTSDGKITAVKYYIIENVLDGAGIPLSEDGLSGEAEVENAVQTTSVDHCYDFGMSYKSTNEYENCKINIKYEVQAMQYRNTTGSDWATLFSDKITGLTV